MKLMKKALILALATIMLVGMCACGCSKDNSNKLVASDLTGAEILDAFWDTDLDASAAKLNGYRAQSVEEVVNNWRQAKMQGNGAILYSLYSASLKELFLQRMKNEFSIWNFYYGREYEKPLEVLISTPEAVEGTDMYYALVTSILSDGTTSSYDIYIELVDGGYFVVSEQAPETVQ